MSIQPSSPPPTARQTTLDWALHYAGMGWSVVPVRPGEKVPAIKWQNLQSLAADVTTIQGWFDTEPNFGIGLIQGHNAGTIVLDFDARDGGMETLAQLDAQGLPVSVRAFTPGGGVHVILRHPGRDVPTRKNVLPGMDVRGDGGFIVAHPSIHPNGRRYEWDVDCHPDDYTPADCPSFILEVITAPLEASTVADAGIVRMPAPGIFGIPQELVNNGREQYMRDTVLAVALELRGSLGRLPTEDEVFDAAWPQYSAKVDLSRPGRGPEEMRAKIRYTLTRLRAGQIKGVGVEHPPEETLKEIRTDGRAPSPLPLVYFNDAEPNLTASDFVEGLLSTAAFSVVYGPSNCGKTFFATDLGLHVAAGMEWRGRAVDQGAVVYCALEGGSGISNRVAAWRREQGLDGEEIPFAIVPVTINLLDPDADRQKLARTIEIAASELKTPVVLIVIDTLSRAMAGGNENAPNDMGAVVNSADFIRQATKAHVMFIHHSGKDDSKGARGHSSLRAATDTEIEVTRSDSKAASFARVTKQREMEIEGEFGFKLRTVELGTNRRGKPVTSCVVEPVDGSAPKAGTNRELTGNNKLALVALRQAIAARGVRRTGDPDIPSSVLSVTTEEWRHEFYARMPDHEQEAKRKAFSRATTELQNRKRAVVMNGIAWVLEAESG